MGRFINGDGYASTGGIIGTNMFAYCNNNPIVYSDPTGHFIGTLVGAICGGVIGGVSAAINGTNILVGVVAGTVGGAIAGAGVDLAIASCGTLSGAGAVMAYVGITGAAGAIAGAGSNLISQIGNHYFPVNNSNNAADKNGNNHCGNSGSRSNAQNNKTNRTDTTNTTEHAKLKINLKSVIASAAIGSVTNCLSILPGIGSEGLSVFSNVLTSFIFSIPITATNSVCDQAVQQYIEWDSGD